MRSYELRAFRCGFSLPIDSFSSTWEYVQVAFTSNTLSSHTCTHMHTTPRQANRPRYTHDKYKYSHIYRKTQVHIYCHTHTDTDSHTLIHHILREPQTQIFTQHIQMQPHIQIDTQLFKSFISKGSADLFDYRFGII